MKADVCVIGAGVIGITTALELQARGANVILVDRQEPGKQTSFGNAGVLSASTVLNVNNPGLFKFIPSLIAGKSPYFTYNLRHVVSRLPWLINFLRFATAGYTESTAKVLHALQTLSIDRHETLTKEAGADAAYKTRGWLKLYRNDRGFRSSELERRMLDLLEVPYRCLTASDIEVAEPALNPVFQHGIHLSTTKSVIDPFLLCKSYLDLFITRGGRLSSFDVCSIRPLGDGQWISASGGELQVLSNDVVIACGPWADSACRMLGYNIPMAWERGYHVNVESLTAILNRPVCDVQRGFVMAPQGGTTRITTGVEFAHRDASPNYSQIQRAYCDAKLVAPFGKVIGENPWMGSRPTLPDGLPAIGAAPRHKGIWFNFGHQHIGMSTSTGSAVILADAMLAQPPLTESRAFVPDRFHI